MTFNSFKLLLHNQEPLCIQIEIHLRLDLVTSFYNSLINVIDVQKRLDWQCCLAPVL